MKRFSFFTKSVSNKRKIDILIVDFSKEESKLLECTTKKDGEKHFEKDDVCYYVERFGFDTAVKLANSGSYDKLREAIFESDAVLEWEEYFTDVNEESGTVDFLAINHCGKAYWLERDADVKDVGGYTELGFDVSPTYLVRASFEALIEGVKSLDYKREEKDA